MILDETENLDSFYSKLPLSLKVLFNYCTIYYDTVTQNNLDSYFEFIRRYESILGIDTSYRDKNNILSDQFGIKRSSIMTIGYRELIWLIINERKRLQDNLKIKVEEEEQKTASSSWLCCGSTTIENVEEDENTKTDEIKNRIDTYTINEAKYRLRVDQIYRSISVNYTTFSPESIIRGDQAILIRYLSNYYNNPFNNQELLYYPKCRMIESEDDFVNTIVMLTEAISDERLNLGFLHYASIAWFNTVINRSATSYKNAIRMYYFAI